VAVWVTQAVVWVILVTLAVASAEELVFQAVVSAVESELVLAEELALVTLVECTQVVE
jgi:hypothetical protein